MSIEQRSCPRRIVVQGALDDIVDPKRVRDILEKDSRPECVQEILTNNQMGHQIDLKHFEHYVNIFFNSIL